MKRYPKYFKKYGHAKTPREKKSFLSLEQRGNYDTSTDFMINSKNPNTNLNISRTDLYHDKKSSNRTTPLIYDESSLDMNCRNIEKLLESGSDIQSRPMSETRIGRHLLESKNHSLQTPEPFMSNKHFVESTIYQNPKEKHMGCVDKERELRKIIEKLRKDNTNLSKKNNYLHKKLKSCQENHQKYNENFLIQENKHLKKNLSKVKSESLQFVNEKTRTLLEQNLELKQRLYEFELQKDS